MRSHLMMVLLRLRFLSFVLPSSTTHSTLGVEANNRLGPEGIHRDGRAEASDDRESGGQPEAGFMYSCAYRFESKATSRSSAAFPKKPLGANLGDGEVLVSAEVSLDTETVLTLPGVALEGEEDGLGANLLADRVKSLALVLRASASGAVALATSGPAALQVDGLLARAHLAEDVELTLDEVTGLLSGGVGVEVGVDVGTDDIDDVAEGLGDLRALVDVEGLGNGVRAGVAAELALDGLDELLELGGSAKTVHDGLVTHDDEVDAVPVGPLADGINLLLDVGSVVRAAGLDEDTDDHLEAVLLASRADGVEGTAVGGVDADSGEAGILDGDDVLLNGTSAHAVTVGGVVGSVGDTVVVTIAGTELARDDETATNLGLLLNLGLVLDLGLLDLDLGNLDLGLLNLDLLRSLLLRGLLLGGLNLGLLNLGRRGSGLLGWLRGGLLGGGVRAVDNELVLGDSDSGGRGSVGARGIGGGAGVVHVGLLLDHGNGAGNDSADTSLVADVGGDRGVSTVGGIGVRAGDGGRALNNGGDLADGVGAWWQVGGGGGADSDGLVDNDGLRGNGVGAGGFADGDLRDRDNGDLGGGRGRRWRRRGSLRSGSRLGLRLVRDDCGLC